MLLNLSTSVIKVHRAVDAVRAVQWGWVSRLLRARHWGSFATDEPSPRLVHVETLLQEAWTSDSIEGMEHKDEEVEEEEKEKEYGRKSTAVAPTKAKVEATEPIPPLPTPNSPWPRPQPTTPSPPPPAPPSTLRQIQCSTNRAKPTSSSNSEGGGSPTISPLPLLTSDYPFNLVSEDTLSVPPFPVLDVVVGAKRRHAVMMMLDGSSAPVSTSSTMPSSNCNHGSGSGGNRRRTRSTRNNASHLQNQNVNSIQLFSVAMGIEDDSGQERKRVARR
ncbi:hypothetical protein EDD85DRAFT_961161 [Armillaria nabsnona]|nr:hypothetical protein EDD85DRAFT_961161 [Armillaria nabsnona]